MPMELSPPEGCRFCRSNRLLHDTALHETVHHYVLANHDPVRRASLMIVPHRHVVTPFELTAEELADLAPALAYARAALASHRPEGFTVGWNVGAVAGQTVFHAHLHVMGRFAGGRNTGEGLRLLVATD